MSELHLGLERAEGASAQLFLWLLVTGGNAAFATSDEPKLWEKMREHAERFRVKKWKDMQNLSKGFLWPACL